MRYRALDSNRDYTLTKIHTNTPECVGQAVLTRLLLWYGEWFMDTLDGTPYMQDIVGTNTNYDIQIKARILGTPGVKEIVEYASNVSNTRDLSVNCLINTIYGTTVVSL